MSTVTMSYKEEQEAFVSNLHGTNLQDLLWTLALLPVAILLLEVALSLAGRSHLTLDLVVMVLPLTLSLTLLSEYILHLVIIGSSAVGIAILFKVLAPSPILVDIDAAQCCNDVPADPPRNAGDEKTKPLSSSSKLQFITLFRGGNLLLTCLSILAVDFHTYPRRFGKTELYGWSLMDTGAGTFVIASAITSKYARNAAGSTSGNALQYLVVLGLGVGRMVVIKLLGYQEHVTEYGSQWNFFVTLCCVWLVADVVHTYIFTARPESSPGLLQVPLLSLAIMACHQYSLSYGDLTSYILQADRSTSFMVANREGIRSLFGYAPMYLLSEWFSARYFFFSRGSASGNCDRSSTGKAANSQVGRQMRALLIASAMCGTGWLASTALQRTSRRLANMPFVLMLLCLASLMLAALLAVDTLGNYLWSNLFTRQRRGDSSSRPRSPTLEMMSRHQLVVFMIANLLTGAVNMSMKTLHVPDVQAFWIIYFYMCVVVVLGWAFDQHNNNKK